MNTLTSIIFTWMAIPWIVAVSCPHLHRSKFPRQHWATPHKHFNSSSISGTNNDCEGGTTPPSYQVVNHSPGRIVAVDHTVSKQQNRSRHFSCKVVVCNRKGSTHGGTGWGQRTATGSMIVLLELHRLFIYWNKFHDKGKEHEVVVCSQFGKLESLSWKSFPGRTYVWISFTTPSSSPLAFDGMQ